MTHCCRNRGTSDRIKYHTNAILIVTVVPGLAMFAVAGDEADIALPICQTFQENINLVLGHIVQLDPTGTFHESIQLYY